MKKVFQLLYVILTMDELIIQHSVALFIAVALGVVLCKFTNIKTVVGIACVGLFLVIVGTVTFFSGLIEGWVLLTFSLPFFVIYVVTVGMYYLIKWVCKKR